MKLCPVCRIVLQDSFLFCPDDGSSLKESAQDNGPRAADSAGEAIETERAVKRTGSPVLYCPACAIEYPLTFTHCPVHCAPLTRQVRVSAIKRPSAIKRAEQSETLADPAEDQTRLVHPQAAVETYGSDDPATDDLSEPATGDPLAPGRSMRIAAVLTAVGLGVFAIATVYTFLSSASRKPSVVRQAPAATAQVVQQPLVVEIPYAPPETESQEEVESPTDLEAPPADEALPDQAQNPGVKGKSVIPDKPETARGDEQRSDLRPAPVAAKTLSRATAPEPPIPAGAPGRIEGRLIRVRSTKTSSGYRYDLTFSLEELAGQTTQWERLVVKTRASSGAGHVQTIPFFHRLGASGNLTFTLGVEMRGRAESDWRGQVVCTALGYDSRDRTYRASFGANVMP